MISNSRVLVALASLALALPATAGEAEEPWYFFVKNGTDANVTKLEVSIDKSAWGVFEIGQGLAPGNTYKLVWSPETNDEPCHQWIRATYEDGLVGQPHEFDFCENLDAPIVIERVISSQ